MLFEEQRHTDFRTFLMNYNDKNSAFFITFNRYIQLLLSSQSSSLTGRMFVGYNYFEFEIFYSYDDTYVQVSTYVE